LRSNSATVELTLCVFQSVLITELRIDPLRTQQQLARSLETYGFAVSKGFVQRACKRIGFSSKGVSHKHENKFSIENVLYYADFLTLIRTVPWITLKFSDEASFESRSASELSQLLSHLVCAGLIKARGFAELDRRLEVKMDRAQWAATTFSVSVLTDLSADNGFFVSDPTYGSNDSQDWIEFIYTCVRHGVRMICRLLCAPHCSPRCRRSIWCGGMCSLSTTARFTTTAILRTSCMRCWTPVEFALSICQHTALNSILASYVLVAPSGTCATSAGTTPLTSKLRAALRASTPRWCSRFTRSALWTCDVFASAKQSFRHQFGILIKVHPQLGPPESIPL
jgi:hypothetical protein